MRLEPGERRGDGFPGLFQRSAAHGAGAVDDEHQLHRPARDRGGVAGRYDHQREVAVTRFGIPVRQQVRLDRLAGHPEVEHEVAVGNGRLVGQSYGRGPRLLPIDDDFVRGVQFLDFHAGIETHGDAEIVAGALRRRQVFDRPGHFRRRRLAASRQRGDRVRVSRRVVARADDGGKDEGVPAVLVRQRVEIRDVDLDRVAGLDVGDLLLEDVRPPLHQQAGPVALRPRLAVDGFRFLLLPQDAANGAVADYHQEFADRGFFRKGEEVHGFDLRIERIREALVDLNRADVTGDRGIHGGVLEGQRHEFRARGRVVALPACHHRPGARIRRRRLTSGWLLRGLRDDPEFVGGQLARPPVERAAGGFESPGGGFDGAMLGCHDDLFERLRRRRRRGELRRLRRRLGGRQRRRGRVQRARSEPGNAEEERCGEQCEAGLFSHGVLFCRSVRGSPTAMDAAIGLPPDVVAVTRRSAKSGSPSSMRCRVARWTRPRGSALSPARE